MYSILDDSTLGRGTAECWIGPQIIEKNDGRILDRTAEIGLFERRILDRTAECFTE
jgi:hypothetical protein